MIGPRFESSTIRGLILLHTNLPLELSKEHLPMLPDARFPFVPAGVRAAKRHKGDLYDHTTAVKLGDLMLQSFIKKGMVGKARAQAGAALGPSALLLNFHLWII